jgi:hypothetical protein
MRRGKQGAPNRRWTRLGFFALHLSIISGQLRELEEQGIQGRDGVQSRKRRRGRGPEDEAILHRVLETRGERFWEGFDDGGQLAAFGISHEANRRALKRTGSDSFSSSGANIHGIGDKYALARKASKKSSKTGKGIWRPTPPPHSHPTPKQPTPSRPTPKQPIPNRPTLPHPTPRPPTPRPPTPSPRPPIPTPPPTPTPTPPTAPVIPPSALPPSGGCQVQFNADFLQLSAIPPAKFNDPNDPNEQELGTRYIYNDGLRDQDTLDELVNSNASGSCTRTQARVGNDAIGLQLGRGHCQFTYKLFDGNREITFTASGDVSDSLGGVLSITGGTQTVVGAYGEIELIPVNLLPDGSFEVENGDFFLDPLFYLADASIFVPCS